MKLKLLLKLAPRISSGSPSCAGNLRQPSDNNIEAEGFKSVTVQDKLKEVIASGEKLKYENLVALLENHPWEEATQELFEKVEDYTEYDNGDFNYDRGGRTIIIFCRKIAFSPKSIIQWIRD